MFFKIGARKWNRQYWFKMESFKMARGHINNGRKCVSHVRRRHPPHKHWRHAKSCTCTCASLKRRWAGARPWAGAAGPGPRPGMRLGPETWGPGSGPLAWALGLGPGLLPQHWGESWSKHAHGICHLSARVIISSIYLSTQTSSGVQTRPPWQKIKRLPISYIH